MPLTNSIQSKVSVQNTVSFLVFLAIISFLPFKTVSSAISIGLCLFAIIYSLIRSKSNYLDINQYDRLVLLALSAPFLAILISQSLRQDWILNAYDGPIRLFACCALYWYLTHQSTQISLSIPRAAGLAIILVVLTLIFFPQSRDGVAINLENVLAGTRVTLSHIDAIVFGNSVAILSNLCLAGLLLNRKSISLKNSWLLYLGLLFGVSLVILSQSRSSWLIFLVGLGVSFAISAKNFSIRSILLYLLGLVLSLYLIYQLIPIVESRVDIAIQEVQQWVTSTNKETSSGTRLSMWGMSFELFLQAPFMGYGDKNFAPEFMQNQYLIDKYSFAAVDTIYCCGPHNEFFANLVRSGVWGGLAYLFIYGIPAYLFILQIKNNKKPSLSSSIGIVFIASFFVGSIFGELLSLKFIYSFFGLILTILLVENKHEQR